MTITVLAPAFYTDPAWSTRYLRISAARHNVPIRWYGEGEPYRGWIDVQIDRLIDELWSVDTSHVLYTDSSDAMFLAGLDEIEHKYVVDYRNPGILMSMEQDGINAGGWMARTQCAIDALEWLRHWHFNGDDGNPQTRWREAIADGEIDVDKDVSRHIFHVTGTPFEVREGRIEYALPRRTDCVLQPSLLHWAGGFTDHKVGKAALIEPIWRALGYEGTVDL